jgi:Amt family ammonium transporter
MTGMISPIAAGWAWGGGWLSVIGFHDFCGSGIVHMVGGTASLWGTYICGPRIGKFGYQTLKSI